MRTAATGIGAVLAAVLILSLMGCASEGACEKHGYASSACAAEVQKQEEQACGPGQRIEGFLDCGDREAGEKREFREGYEEAEKEAEFYGR